MTSPQTASSDAPIEQVTHVCDVHLDCWIAAEGHPDETRAWVLNQAARLANRNAVMDEVLDALPDPEPGTVTDPDLVRSEFERRMDERVGVVGARVAEQVSGLKRAISATFSEADEEARASGATLSWRLTVEACAPGSVLSFAPRTIGERLRQALRLSSGASLSPIAPFVSVSYGAKFSGPDDAVERLGRALAGRLALVMPEGTKGPIVHYKPVTMTVYPGATYEDRVRNRLASRQPLPPTGTAFVAAIRETRRAIGSGDAGAAFAAADGIVALVRRDPAVTALLLQGKRPGLGSRRFEVGNARSLTRHLVDLVAGLRAREDLDGLKDLMFSASGIVETIESKVRYETVPGRRYDHHAKPVRSAFGEARNALLHFESFHVDGQRRRPAPDVAPLPGQALLDFLAESGSAMPETADEPDAPAGPGMAA